MCQFEKENVIDGWTPLGVASFHGKTKSTKALLNMGADIFRRNKYTEESVLHHALKSKSKTKCFPS